MDKESKTMFPFAEFTTVLSGLIQLLFFYQQLVPILAIPKRMPSEADSMTSVTN